MNHLFQMPIKFNSNLKYWWTNQNKTFEVDVDGEGLHLARVETCDHEVVKGEPEGKDGTGSDAREDQGKGDAPKRLPWGRAKIGRGLLEAKVYGYLPAEAAPVVNVAISALKPMNLKRCLLVYRSEESAATARSAAAFARQ